MARSISRDLGEKPGKLLHGSDLVAAKKTAIAGVILAVRNAPKGFNSPYIVDFDTDVLPGIASWSCNMTEGRALAAKINDDPDTWAGWGLVLALVQRNNPKTGRDVPSLAVARVTDPKEVKKNRKTKPKYKTLANGGSGGPETTFSAFSDEDIPF